MFGLSRYSNFLAWLMLSKLGYLLLPENWRIFEIKSESNLTEKKLLVLHSLICKAALQGTQLLIFFCWNLTGSDLTSCVLEFGLKITETWAHSKHI
jgi:hypothetical protein